VRRARTPVYGPPRNSRPPISDGGTTLAIEVRAHITGTVWKIETKVGDTVNEGDVLVILESMKMEMPIEAPAGGRILEIKIQEGQPIQEGAVVLTLQD